MLRERNPVVPVTRAMSVLRYADRARALGAPVDTLLARSAIQQGILQHPEAAVPLDNAFRFGELVCRVLGTAHLGIDVGLATSLEDLGPYGRILRSAVTLHDYFRQGIALYSMLTTGQRLWLSDHGQALRLNVATFGSPRLGTYQSELEILVVTIAVCRLAAGPDWAPAEVSVAYRPREAFPDIAFFNGSRIVRGSGATYMTIPREVMQLSLPQASGAGLAEAPQPAAAALLPESFGGLVQLQIEALLSDRAACVEVVAGSLNVSRRTLQRRLLDEGVVFSRILDDTRIRKAAEWLRRSEKPVIEIALDLGYADPSNFTRAFHRRTGVSPSAFRHAALAT